jgi:predicted DNA-binding transcriptional regulator AlpA
MHTPPSETTTQQRPRKPITVSLTNLPDDALVSKDEVDALTGLKRARRYELIKEGRFPAPLLLSPHCARWRMGQLRRWLADPLGYKDCVATEAV